MPGYWYNIRDNIVRDGDDAETAKRKQFNRSITAANKPYFMTFVYPSLRKKNSNYIRDNNRGVIRRFSKCGLRSISDLEAYESRTKAMDDYLDYYYRFIPVGNNPCVVNRICWTFEREFDGYLTKRLPTAEFDPSILKSNVEYSRQNYNEIYGLYQDYKRRVSSFQKQSHAERMDSYDIANEHSIMTERFRRDCQIVCSNEKELCDILIDICYASEGSKQFVWDMCGDVILDNLLANNGGIIEFPVECDGDGDFAYAGSQFVMCSKKVDGENDDNS